MNTLLLDRTIWDLCKDASGNIAMASDPYASAQDVASVTRLFKGELWYDTTQGIPYTSEVLGKQISLGLFKTLIIQAALTVPNVATVQVFISGFKDRTITGQIQSTLATAKTVVTELVLPDRHDITDEYALDITDQVGNPIEGPP